MLIKLDRELILPFQRTKTSMNSGSQSLKGILATNFTKTTHFDFFFTSINSDFLTENH